MLIVWLSQPSLLAQSRHNGVIRIAAGFLLLHPGSSLIAASPYRIIITTTSPSPMSTFPLPTISVTIQIWSLTQSSSYLMSLSWQHQLGTWRSPTRNLAKISQRRVASSISFVTKLRHATSLSWITLPASPNTLLPSTPYQHGSVLSI